LKSLILKVIIWLIIVNVFAFAGLNRFNLTSDTAYTWITPESFPVSKDSGLISMHARWDSYWYLDIVQNGYYLKTDNTLANVVFFPLYPALIKILGTIFLGNFVLAGWILSMIFLILACAYFYKFTKEFHPKIDPELPVLLMLIFPTAFFFNVVYTESIFLFLTIITFYYAFRKNFYLAGFFAFLGALTHSNGVFLALPIFWKIIENDGWKTIFSLKYFKKIIPVLFAPLGSFLFLGYDYLKFGDPFLFFKIQSNWGRSFSINWEHFSFFSRPSITNMFIDIFLAIFIISAVVVVYKKLSPLYAIFMSTTLIAAFTSGTLMSVGRYSLVMFPLFILLASIKNKNFRFGWVLFSSLFFALDIVLWVNNYWAG
jgi:Gpi18-like mannosyltransferase